MSAKRKVNKLLKNKSSKKGSSFKSSSRGSKPLTRSKNDKMIAGVLGGISQYLGFDATILRLIWIAIVAFTGFVPGVLAYGVAAMVMPEK